MAILTVSTPSDIRAFTRHWRALLGLLALAAGVPSVHGAPTDPTEYEMKSVFLFNFTRFVTWPPETLSADQPIIIGVIGNDPTGALIDSVIKGEAVEGHPLAVKRFTRPEDIANCQVLFVTRGEAPRLREILERVKGRSILTVSDIDRFVYLGGMIGLPLEDGKVRVQINLQNAKSEKLNLSAKLLRPAQLVIQQKPQSSRFLRESTKGVVLLDDLLSCLIAALPL